MCWALNKRTMAAPLLGEQLPIIQCIPGLSEVYQRGHLLSLNSVLHTLTPSSYLIQRAGPDLCTGIQEGTPG